MKKIKLFALSLSILSFFLLNSCSCNDDNTATTLIYPDIETIAKEHAMQFADKSLSEMQIQQKLFEIKAHEQDLREANMDAEADFYIKSFKKHLKNFNVKLSNEIDKQ